MSESDGVEEVVEGLSRTGIAVAGRLGERFARMREQELREQQAREEQRGRELQSRYESQREAARAQLAPVARSEWWDQARQEDIERVQETATAWKEFDPVAQEAAERIRQEVGNRYGVDVDRPGADDRAVSEALAETERHRTEAARQRNAADRAGTEAALLLAAAEREDRSREAQVEAQNAAAEAAGPYYDSEERRQSLAASLEGKADAETINARVLAARDQATPPAEAVKGKAGRTRAAKRKSGAVPSRKAQRGISR